MPQINQLSPVSQVSSSDQIPVYATQNGDARKMSVNQLLQYFQQTFASPTMSTNIYTPTTGFNISVPNPAAEQQWLSLQPAGTLATGTITLPLNTITLDGAEVLVTSTQQITALTISLNGAANLFGINATSRLNAGGSLRLRYIQSVNSWYNITNSVSNPDIGAATGTSLVLGGALSANTVASNTSVSGVSGTFTGTVGAFALTSTTSVSSATLSTSGAVTIGTTLGVTGATTLAAASATSLSTSGSQLVTGTGKQGYTTGSGGSVAQAIIGAKTSGVTLNKATGFIETDATGLIAAGGTVKFTFTNSFITARDIVVLNYAPNSVGAGATSGAYGLNARVSNAGGSCDISITNLSAGNLTEALWINFAVISGSST